MSLSLSGIKSTGMHPEVQRPAKWRRGGCDRERSETSGGLADIHGGLRTARINFVNVVESQFNTEMLCQTDNFSCVLWHQILTTNLHIGNDSLCFSDADPKLLLRKAESLTNGENFIHNTNTSCASLWVSIARLVARHLTPGIIQS